MSINLMPWREERRKKQQKEFMAKLGMSALTGVAVLVFAGVVLSAQISGQNNRNALLEREIAEAEKDIAEIKTLEAQKEQLLGRKNVIESLDASRHELAHAFYEIAKNTTESVVLTSIEHKTNMLEVQGLANSNSSVAKFVEAVDQSEWFDKTEIIIIQNKDSVSGNKQQTGTPSQTLMGYAFTVRTALKNPNLAEQEEEAEAAPAKEKRRRR